MSRKNRNTIKNLKTMVAERRPWRVVRGNEEVPLIGPDEHVAELMKGTTIMPPIQIMLGEVGAEKPPPAAAVVFEELAHSGQLCTFMKTFIDWHIPGRPVNAYEMSAALMLDLILAQRSEGWRLVRADERTKSGYASCSWLEYEQSAVSGGGGLVKIWPAWYYRAISDARNVTEQDAAQVQDDWRKHDSPFYHLLNEGRVASRVRLLDSTTRAVTEIPVEELAPGTVRVQMAGIKEPVWVDGTKLRPSDRYYHPPFPPEKRKVIAKIADALREVYPISLDEWEDGFRRDLLADQQIFNFTCIADAYQHVEAQGDLPLPKKVEYYRTIVLASTCSLQELQQVMRPQLLSRGEALAAAGMYWRVFNERGGPEKAKQWAAELKRVDGFNFG